MRSPVTPALWAASSTDAPTDSRAQRSTLAVIGAASVATDALLGRLARHANRETRLSKPMPREWPRAARYPRQGLGDTCGDTCHQKARNSPRRPAAVYAGQG